MDLQVNKGTELHSINLFQWFVTCLLFVVLAGNSSVIAKTGSVVSDDEDPRDALLTEAGELFDSGQEEEALDIYLKLLKRDETHYEALWNASLLYTRKGKRQASFSQQQIYYKEGRKLAEYCMKFHPDKPRSYYVYGVAAAGMADDLSNSSERMQLVREIKEYGEKALEMDPEYAPAWHLMGLWHSKVANLSRTERLGVRLLYGSLPDGASNRKAEEFLLRAVELDPDVILFRLDLAQHYQETGQANKAIPVLRTLLQMRPVSQNDFIDMLEARDRLNDLS